MTLKDLPHDELSPARVWRELDEDTRKLAATSLYDDAAGRREADQAVARAIRFREAALRRLPVEQRAAHLLRSVRPDDSLAGSLLMALHVQHRRPMLEAFLTDLNIPQNGGIIDESYELTSPEPEALSAGVNNLYEKFSRSEVEVYLASLLALDPDTWGGLAELLRR